MTRSPKEQVLPLAQLTPLMEEILSQGGSLELTATGNSMRPMLFDRKSRVRLVAPGELRRGDVPLYRREDGHYVLHRMIGKEQSGYVFCGDAQWVLERGIKREQLAAVMTDFTWRGRWVSCNQTGYQFYWRFWLAIRPLRHVVQSGWRRLRRLSPRG